MAERNAPNAGSGLSLCLFRGPGWTLQPLRPGPWCPSHSQSSDILVLTKGWLISAFIKHVLTFSTIVFLTTSQVLDLIWHVLNKDSGPYVPFSECAAGHAQLSIRRSGASKPTCMRTAHGARCFPVSRLGLRRFMQRLRKQIPVHVWPVKSTARQ